MAASEMVLTHVSGRASMSALRKGFERCGNKVSLGQFIALVLPLLPDNVPREDWTIRLMDIFDEIDINGDGAMEWDEFTLFCIHNAVAATRREESKVPHIRYEAVPYFSDPAGKGGRIVRVHHLCPPRSHLVCVLERGSPIVRVYTDGTGENKPGDDKVLPPVLIDVTVRVNASGASFPPVMEALPVCVTSMHSLSWLAISSTDMTITFWDMDKEFQFVKFISTVAVQLHMAPAPNKQFLYTVAQESQQICVWDVRAEFTLNRIEVHEDAITSMEYIPGLNLIATTSLDKSICLFSPVDKGLNLTFTLRGHKRGVAKVIYSKRWDALISCAYEATPLMWHWGSQKIVLHLEGHTHPVRDLAEFWFPRAQGNMPNILTMDDTGVFKVWDLVPVRAGQATCLMTIRLDMLTGVMCPEAFAFMGSTCTILTGRNRLQLFSPNAVSDADVIPIASVYNPLTMRFVTGVDSSFRIYDHLGHQVDSHVNVLSSPVTAFCLDDRNRKLIAGKQDGTITVLNFASGAVMKRAFHKHAGEVTAIAYVPEDRLIVSVSWDRNIHIYDERDSLDLVLIRQVIEAHSADILGLSVSRLLSLIATSAADGTVRVWDFQMLDLLAKFDVHQGAVRAIRFLDPFPALITAGTGGKMCIWAVRGASSRIRNTKLMDWGHLPGNMPHAPEDYEVGMLLSQLTDATGLFASGSPPKQGFAARLQNAVKKGPIRTLPDRWPGIMSVSATEGSNGVTSVTSRFVVDERATPPIKKLYITYGDENGVLSVIEVFPQLSEHGVSELPLSRSLTSLPSYAPYTTVFTNGSVAGSRYARPVTAATVAGIGTPTRHFSFSPKTMAARSPLKSPLQVSTVYSFKSPLATSFKSPKSHSPSPPAGPTRKTSPLAVQSSLPAPVAPAAQAFTAGAAVSSQSSAVSLSAGSVISDSGSESTRGSVNVNAVAKPAGKAATAAGPTESGKSTIVSRWKRAGLSLGFVPDAMPKPLKSSPRLVAQWRGQSDMILSMEIIQEPLCILATSLDSSTKVWSLVGHPMGTVFSKIQDYWSLQQSTNWFFAPNQHSRAANARLKARSLLEKLDDPLYSSMLVKGPPSPKGKASPKGFNGVEAASSFFTGSTPGGTPRGAEPPAVEEDGVKEKHDGILRQLTVTSTALGPDGKLLPAPVKAVKKAPPATTIDPHTGAATIDFKEVLGEDEVVANKTTDEQVMSVDITDLSALKSLSTVLGVTGFDTVNGAQLQKSILEKYKNYSDIKTRVEVRSEHTHTRALSPNDVARGPARGEAPTMQLLFSPVSAGDNGATTSDAVATDSPTPFSPIRDANGALSKSLPPLASPISKGQDSPHAQSLKPHRSRSTARAFIARLPSSPQQALSSRRGETPNDESPLAGRINSNPATDLWRQSTRRAPGSAQQQRQSHLKPEVIYSKRVNVGMMSPGARSRLEKCGDFLNKVEDIATNGAPLSPAPTFSLPLPTPSTLTARDPPFPSPKPRDVPALEIVLDVDKERTMKEMCWDDSQKEFARDVLPLSPEMLQGKVSALTIMRSAGDRLSNAGRYSSFIDLKLFIEFLRAGGANVDRDLVSLRKLRETPQYHDAMGRFPVLLAEYFPKLHVETIIRLSDSNPPTSRAKSERYQMYTNLTKFIATAFAGIAPDEIEMILREVNKPFIRIIPRVPGGEIVRQKATAREIFKALDKEGTGRITTKQLFDRLEPDMDIVVDKSSFQAMCIEAGVDPARGITAEGFVKMFYEFM